ncbi:efflux RND transporter permease subunit [Paludisphaera borealis]|uniref:Efflux pump membrane transporter BepE n=1 Tax=Paludisphaera borealis TaxID=1387353 RepID=A0A1U7CP65_9BACT|nr:efflux RND transporter permease subunit [Paludisphaera borealis]APW60673.1 Efflux pump membrane transporter BepE [Paludisphaera borealis]
MISHFFIDRPIFATVLSIVITLAGALALWTLPVAQFPPITPPSIQVAINYPGASAQVVADTVAAPIEQQVNGVQGMLYMSSRMGNDGSYTLTVTFDIDVDLNTALVMVQNRVALAMPQLPTSVQNQGITIRKKTPDILMIINFFSPDRRYNDIQLSNFATISVKDELLRVPGVSDVAYLGLRDYSIRAWLDPQKLASKNMTAMEVANAVRSQNQAAAPGQTGQPPSHSGQSLQLPIHTLGRLTEPEEFGEIIVKVDRAAPRSLAMQSPSTPRTAGTGPTPASLSTAPEGPSLLATILQIESTSGSAVAGASSLGTPIVGPLPRLGAVGGSRTTSTASSSAAILPAGPTSVMPSGGATAPGGGATPGGGSAGGGGDTGGGATPGAGATGGNSAQPATGDQRIGGALGSTSGPSIGTTERNPSDAVVRLRDVARVELGAQNYNQSCIFDGQPSVGIALFQLPNTNALDVADQIKSKMRELRTRFPEGIEYAIPYDTTPFISESIAEVIHTLLEAVALVALVVLVFLQNWRAVLIPLVAVPVAIIGTFSVMAVLGFSLNTISLFGLVLAIGIVVDDAIVVVENVERWLAKGLSPRDAARQAMDEVTGPVVAVSLVLCAVFIPCAMISGITGRFFRQFAVTIAVSTLFSAFNSLTLSPALAAILLKGEGGRRDPLTWLLDTTLGWFFRLFNKAFGMGTSAYGWAVEKLLRGSFLVCLVYAGLLYVTFLTFSRAPTGFIPEQDQGRLIVNVQLPDSASLQRTNEVMAKLDKVTRETPGVAHVTAISGISFVQTANSSNFGSMFVILDPFDERQSPELTANGIMARLRKVWAKQIREAQVVAFGAPAIPGLSVAGGFRLMVEDRGGLGLPALQFQTDSLTKRLAALPGLVGLSNQFRSNTPQLFMAIDRTKVESLGVPLEDLNNTLQIYLGSLYVGNFNAFGRSWQVNLQADGQFRDRVEDVNLLQVRNKWGGMVPLGTLVDVRDIGGPVFLTRYNLSTAAPITGGVLPGLSTGEAIKAIDEQASHDLPLSMKTEWTELMFMQIKAGDTTLAVFSLAIACVFLALAALYESWSLPLAVILVVPLSLLCSVAGVLYTGNSVNIFVQIGLVVLVGLACKNAILIVEFALELNALGRSRFDATVEASRLRLRPILMTSLAFILGVVPLVLANGAGAEMRKSLGTAVFSGMLGVTIFGIFLTPVFYYVIKGLGESRLLSGAFMKRIGSPIAGGLLGAASGFLVAWLRSADEGRTMALGAAIGVLMGLMVLGLGRLRAGRPAALKASRAKLREADSEPRPGGRET